jgi:hypothetical protein
MVAGARFVHPIQILAFHDSTVGIPDPSESCLQQAEPSVVAFLAEVLPRLGRKEVVLGAIEMAAMRKFPGDAVDLEVIEEWIAQQGQLAEEAAFDFIRFGGDSFPSRRDEPAVRMAVAALRGTGKDYFERLLHMGDTDYPITHFGLIRAFGLLKEARAIPYLSACLKDERKQMRAAAVEALGRIGTAEAVERVKQAAHDPAKNVQRAVQSVVGHGG